MQPLTMPYRPLVVAMGLVLFGATAWTFAQAQTAIPQPAVAPVAKAPVNMTAPGTVAPAGAARAPQASQPAWKDLSPAQQKALAPLEAQWPTINTSRKAKWIEVSKNYASLPPAEQAKLHTRMSDWTALSPQERAQARQNFAQNQALTNGLTPEQRNAQWQAYQLLSPEEKSKLAASSPKPPAGPAVALRPADPLKSSPPPKFGTAKALANQGEPANVPVSKISIAPHLQKSNSLMPQKSTVSIADPTLPVTRQ